MTREEIINEINCLLSELDNGDDAVSYLTQNDVNWLKENIKALEQETCEDAVSRTEVLNLVRFNAFHVKSQIKAIENMPSVTPQEQFKPMVEIDLYSVIKQSYIEREVLDKIDEVIADALDKSTDQKESQTLRWVLDKISEVT